MFNTEKSKLLYKMVRFQEKRSRQGRLTFELISEGIELFTKLNQVAETDELKLLTKSYLNHLQFEKRSEVDQKAKKLGLRLIKNEG